MTTHGLAPTSKRLMREFVDTHEGTFSAYDLAEYVQSRHRQLMVSMRACARWCSQQHDLVNVPGFRWVKV